MPGSRSRSRSPLRTQRRSSPRRGGGGKARDVKGKECRVYVSNLTYDVKWMELKDFLKKRNEIRVFFLGSIYTPSFLFCYLVRSLVYIPFWGWHGLGGIRFAMVPYIPDIKKSMPILTPRLFTYSGYCGTCRNIYR